MWWRERGWMRVANVDAQDDCPNGWKITSPTTVCRLLTTMMDVMVVISLLMVFHTGEYVEWQ